MDSTRRIVLATDFSQPAEQAARVAARLAARREDVTVVHATPVGAPVDVAGGAGLGAMSVPYQSYAAPELTDTTLVREQLATWCARVGLAAARQRVEHGPPGAAIARVAKEEDARLLVVGATGRSGIERLLLGSTATAALHESARDVLIVRQPESPEPGPDLAFARAVVAVDLVDDAFIERAAAFALPMIRAGGVVTLAHVHDQRLLGLATEPEDARARLHALNVARLEGLAHERLVEGKPADALRDLTRELHADVVVVGDHQHGMIDRLLIGSITEQLAREAPCSVLVVKPPRS